MKKFFEILELDMSASIEEVERAYKELTDAWRPENYQNLPRFKRKAEIKLKEVNDAYARVKSYLLLKQSGEVQKVLVEPAEPSPKSDLETMPLESTLTPQNNSPARKKTRVLALIAVFAVLSALMLYLISGRLRLQDPERESIVPEKEKPAPISGTAVPLVSADQLKEGSISNSAGNLSTENQSTSAKVATPRTALRKRSSDEIRLTPKVLSRYNRNPVRIKRIQNGLITIGYNPGPIDGVIGPQTTKALKQFAADNYHVIETGDLMASDFTEAVLVFAEVAAFHPDWNRIIGSENFARWLDSQTEIPAYRVKQFKKSATAQQIMEMLALYKSAPKRIIQNR